MREILFRGKQETGLWVFGYYVEGNRYDSELPGYVILENSITRFVNPETVGQFTGVIDKNGNKIFEGDILKGFSGLDGPSVVKFGEFDFEYVNCLGFYIFTNTKFTSFSTVPLLIDNEYEVIGNIHDNKDLWPEKASDLDRDQKND